MGLKPTIHNIPHQWQRHRDGPVDMETTANGLLLPGRDALISFEEDFMGERPTLISASGVTGWHLDESGSSTAGLAITAAGHGGVATLTPGSTGGNNTHYQWANNTTVLEPFTMAVGKRLWLRTRFKIEDADQNLLLMGLHEATDDPWNAYPNDMFAFRTVAAAPSVLQFAGGTSNSAHETISLNTLADDTWYRAEAFYDGASTVRAWVWADDGGFLAQGHCDFGSTIVPGTPMGVGFGAEAVDTGADVFSLDCINAYMER